MIRRRPEPADFVIGACDLADLDARSFFCFSADSRSIGRDIEFWRFRQPDGLEHLARGFWTIKYKK